MQAWGLSCLGCILMYIHMFEAGWKLGLDRISGPVIQHGTGHKRWCREMPVSEQPTSYNYSYLFVYLVMSIKPQARHGRRLPLGICEIVPRYIVTQLARK